MSTPSAQPPANKAPAPLKAQGQPETHDAWEQATVISLKDVFQDAIVDAKEYDKEITVTIKKEKLLDICTLLKKNGFTYLIDIVGLHFPKEEKPFTLVYYLHHMGTQERIRLKLSTNENDPVPSVTGIWKTSNWMEREAFDLFGIQFSNHPNLKRILMWEGFNGHPLRKDFPLLGIDTGAAIYQDVYPENCGPLLKQITPKKDA